MQTSEKGNEVLCDGFVKYIIFTFLSSMGLNYEHFILPMKNKNKDLEFQQYPPPLGTINL
jgi:uncharacterized protein YdeI (YjbR/CyaY-like superfamily)